MDGWQIAVVVAVLTIVVVVAGLRAALRGRRVPVKAKLAIAGAVLWLLSPLDVLPDALFPVGVLDDLAVLAAAVKYVLDQVQPAQDDSVQRRIAGRRAIDARDWRLSDDPPADR